MEKKHRAGLPSWTIVSVFLLFALASTVRAQVSFDLTDLGTLGGSSSSAASMGGQHGRNAAGLIVGTSKAGDNSPRAFLYANGQMSDLNSLCDLTKTNFAVLTAATSIDDDGAIIGEGTLTDGTTHAFLLMPVLVDGGRWSYTCCNWVWKQVDGATGQTTGWWWEPASHRYNWHGPGGKHPGYPPNPPHCWNWPLPCPPETGATPNSSPTPTPTPGTTQTPTPTPGTTPIRFPHNVGLITPTPTPGPPISLHSIPNSVHLEASIPKIATKPTDLVWCCHRGNGQIVITTKEDCVSNLGNYCGSDPKDKANLEKECAAVSEKKWWYCDGAVTLGPVSTFEFSQLPISKNGVNNLYPDYQSAAAACTGAHPAVPQQFDSLKTTIYPGSPRPLPPGTSNGPLTNPRFPNSIPSNSPGNLTPQNIPKFTPVPRVTPIPRQHGTPNPNITKGRLAPRLTPKPKGPPIHLRHPRLNSPNASPTAPVVR